MHDRSKRISPKLVEPSVDYVWSAIQNQAQYLHFTTDPKDYSFSLKGVGKVVKVIQTSRGITALVLSPIKAFSPDYSPRDRSKLSRLGYVLTDVRHRISGRIIFVADVEPDHVKNLEGLHRLITYWVDRTNSGRHAYHGYTMLSGAIYKIARYIEEFELPEPVPELASIVEERLNNRAKLRLVQYTLNGDLDGNHF
jgi:hypothetical protein